MSAAGSVVWGWRADPSPPEPCAAVGWHATAITLHARLARLAVSQQARLQVSATHAVLVVTGEPADLPWVPGVAYAAPCPDVPTLWRPTLLQPDVAPDLLARSLRRLHMREPLLLWHEPVAVVPLDRQLQVAPELLQRIAARWQCA